jgi:hypothetical protein
MSERAIDDNDPFFDDPFPCESSVEGSLAIIRALDEITFLDRMQPIMAEVARLLIKAGADFSKCK